MNKNDKGYTIIELLVASSILTLVMSMLIGYVLAMQNHFFEDIVRTRINSNLRSAFDIIGMNIRQSGENLQRSFPAVILSTDSDGVGQRLQLRRNLIPEVLTVCAAISSGATSIDVSSTTSSDSSCIYANVTTSFNAFLTEKNNTDDTVYLFIYNATTKNGEFVSFNSSSTSTTYRLNTSSIQNAYPANTSYIYFIEEYAFRLDEATQTLFLYRNGQQSALEAVAFMVSQFNSEITFEDNSVATSLAHNGSSSWKQIKNISTILTGTENWKSRTFSTSVTGDFFPRNVISR